MKKYLFLFLIIAFICVVFFFNSETSTGYSDETFTDWIGKEIVFLPQPPSLQKYGYQLFTYQPAVGGSIPYNDLANKSAIITDIKDDNGILQATIKTEDGKIVYGQGYGRNFEHIAFKSELENAIKEYSEKTVWLKAETQRAIYIWDQATNKSQKIKLPNLEKMIVSTIEWGWNSFEPLKFTLKRETGDLVLWNGSFSRINDTSNHLLRPFDESWYLTDPKKLYQDWPDKIWSLIRESKISIGMAKDMVLMSWGEPKKVNKTITAKVVSEQWVYSLDEYVYFENGIVTAIQQ